MSEAALNPIRLLVICLSQSWGGLEQVAATDALEIAATGVFPHMLVLKDSPIHRHLSKIEGIHCVPIDYRPRDFLDLRLRADLKRLIEENGVNLIHIHQPTLLGSIAPWLWSYPRVGLVATRHIMSTHSKRDPYHRFLYARVDQLMVISQSVRRNVLLTHGIRPAKVRVVNLGLDFEVFDPDRVDALKQREKWGADPETLIIGLVGRIDPAKGQATFIRSAAGLMKARRAGEKIKFVIVGEETLGSTQNYVQELSQMVGEFRMERDVVFAGYQENIPEVMRAFDIFVMPSRQEAFGLVAIEAMAMECPIVISRGGSAEEIVGQEEFGLTIRPEDAFDLQAKLRHMIDHPVQRMEMGRKARNHVRANYDRKVRLQNTLAVYREVLAVRS